MRKDPTEVSCSEVTKVEGTRSHNNRMGFWSHSDTNDMTLVHSHNISISIYKMKVIPPVLYFPKFHEDEMSWM